MKIQNSKFKVQSLLIIILLTVLLLPLVSQAGLVPCGLSKDDPVQPGDQNVPCQFCHLFVLFKNIINFLLVPSDVNNQFPLVLIIAILLLVIGGGMYLLYVEDPSWVEKSRSLMKSVIIGLLLIYSAWLIVNLFFQIIGVQTWTGLGNWWQINCPLQ